MHHTIIKREVTLYVSNILRRIISEINGHVLKYRTICRGITLTRKITIYSNNIFLCDSDIQLPDVLLKRYLFLIGGYSEILFSENTIYFNIFQVLLYSCNQVLLYS